MKTLKLFVIAVLFLNLSLNSFSQGNLAFNIMGALPISDYGSDNLDSEKSGGAGFGLGLGLKYVYPLMENGLGFFGGIDVIYNGYKKSVKDDTQDMYDQLVGSEVNIKWPKIFNIPLSAGLNFTKITDSGIGIFANAGLTYNFLKVTDIILEANNEEITGKTDLTSAFGFKVGGGLQLNEKTSIFINYLGLGNHDINMELKGGGESQKVDSEQKVDMITIGVGFRF